METISGKLNKINKPVSGDHLEFKILDLRNRVQDKNKADIEHDFTETFWEEIIIAREGTRTLKEALWKGNTEFIQINFYLGIGDITYLNKNGELVAIEVKRTAGVFIDKKGVLLHSWQPGNVNQYTKDIIKTALYAAGREFWEAIRGLKGQGELFNKDPSFLEHKIAREVQKIAKRGHIKVKSEMMFLTVYRQLKKVVSKNARLDRLSFDDAPVAGFHIQRINMNRFLEYGKELNLSWKFPDGDNFEISKNSSLEEHIGMIYAYIISKMSYKVLKPNRKEPKIESFMIMVLFDIFSYLKRKNLVKFNNEDQ